MKASCPHCQSEVSVRPFTKLKNMTCPVCSRLVFLEERTWGKLWILFCILCALAVGFIVYWATAEVKQMWSIYLIYLAPAAVVLVLAPFGNPLMYFVHQAKEKKSRR